MLHCLSLPTISSSTIKFSNLSSISPSPTQPLYIKFRTSYRENLRHLKRLGIVDPNTKPNKLPLPDEVDQMFVLVNFLRTSGFSDPDLERLNTSIPQLFNSNIDPTDIAPVFQFLANDLNASVPDSCGLILKCPKILFSDVEFGLRPTLDYLKQLGIEKLNVPSNLKAHLLNTRVEKLQDKIRFLESLGFSKEEAKRACGRLPAIFGYSIDHNLKPKLDYLVKEMDRSMDELKEFPQYFAFSLEGRIVPRHLHLQENHNNVKVKLNKMLLLNDKRFYAKWSKHPVASN